MRQVGNKPEGNTTYPLPARKRMLLSVQNGISTPLVWLIVVILTLPSAAGLPECDLAVAHLAETRRREAALVAQPCYTRTLHALC